MNQINLAITGVSSFVAEPISIHQWASDYKVPDRQEAGKYLDGKMVEKILGIKSKSWAPDVFKDPQIVINTTKEAMRRANVEPGDIDAAIIVTCSPFMVQLDQDAFLLYKEIGLKDHIVPVLLGAGCAGFARAMALAAQMNARTTLLISYSLSSLYTQTAVYKNNVQNPYGKSLWMSAALFSDGVSAVVLKRTEAATGFSFYSRDSIKFGEEAGFDDPLIHYTGSGAWAPPGTEECEALSCFAMSGPKIKEYYIKGMTLNHEQLQAIEPGYLGRVKKIYTHQASPMLTNAFLETLIKDHGISRDKMGINVVKYGNLVSTSTIKLLDDDLQSGILQSGDSICISVVGAGPERGAFIIPVVPAA
ncbi:3-oxoacyl-[acyl-carrier-protein] synthase III C-terminal domain-containing protein [Paraflavitalea sp. CAU 1676]|uniref:3-oxoacyl-[acyl-carrier-protein] synthase III C-terminal domain-containing protein n=1 Tax=Paraflavitalea sp. CAU 1676 TaxID=3032598 RepID=UPI0023DA665E|nr:3-oxoacyl-[acyl-carrier-protein] synthase III C-terminal domain-containing protein [Paraflavitalea sp. CAU 1676]MDF2188852.1 3-oxoacyl-[acyl-carrier-protein] synthase III C-terminal domain-containing protein [Paraflavitalea sp. CAU 1676]